MWQKLNSFQTIFEEIFSKYTKRGFKHLSWKDGQKQTSMLINHENNIIKAFIEVTSIQACGNYKASHIPYHIWLFPISHIIFDYFPYPISYLIISHVPYHIWLFPMSHITYNYFPALSQNTHRIQYEPCIICMLIFTIILK